MPPTLFWYMLGVSAIIFALAAGLALVVSQIPEQYIANDQDDADEEWTT